MIVPEPDLSSKPSSRAEVTPRRAGTSGDATASGGGAEAESGDGPEDDRDTPTDDVLNIASGSDEDDAPDFGDGENGGVAPEAGVEHISQRLGRARRGVRVTAQGSGDQVPGGVADANVSNATEDAAERFGADLTHDFIVYVGSNVDRAGSVRQHAQQHKLQVVMVDKKIGGYEHDISHSPVAEAMGLLVKHTMCVGVFASIDCGTWSALRYLRPGPPVLRRLPSELNGMQDEALGIRRADGTLPESVRRANETASNLAHILGIAAESSKEVALECPVSRAASSQFAIEGREDHADMMTHPALIELERRHGLRRLFFDQCMFGSAYEKTTQIVASIRLYRAMSPRFRHRTCDGKHEHKPLIGGQKGDGAFASEGSEEYPSDMNKAISDSYAEVRRASPPAALASDDADPMSTWAKWLQSTPVKSESEDVTEQAFHAAFHPHPLCHARAAVASAPNSWWTTMQWSGIDGQAFPLPAEEYAGDNPSYNQTINNPSEAADWAESRRSEMENLRNHDAYTEVAEDSLPSWDPQRAKADEVVNTLWVHKKKRGGKGEVTTYKSRCVFDGRHQKASAHIAGKELNSYAPCGRPSTHKMQIATAVFHRRRHKCFDVTGAYLKGKFLQNEVVYARPPPGERRFIFRDGLRVAVVWRLNVPLYGEVDAGYVWNRTATHQLVSVQGFQQSQYDPGYFWKIFADGTRMDLLLYVDDAYVTDDNAALADAELEAFGMAFADKDGKSGITVQVPEHFLGANIDVSADSSEVTISSRAYVTQMAKKYLAKPLEEYKTYRTPCAKDIIDAYEQARDKLGLIDGEAKAAYASKCGAGIFAGPCSRFDALYALGMCSRCLTFPTERMCAAVDRVIAYLAQTADRGIRFVTDDDEYPSLIYEAYSDSDWCVQHSTTGTCPRCAVEKCMPRAGGSSLYHYHQQRLKLWLRAWLHVRSFFIAVFSPKWDMTCESPLYCTSTTLARSRYQNDAKASRALATLTDDISRFKSGLPRAYSKLLTKIQMRIVQTCSRSRSTGTCSSGMQAH